MKKYTIPTIVLLFSLFACTEDESLTLNIPESGFEVVQHIPKDEVGRDQNPLYLTPRKIRDGEFNTEALNTLIDSMYAIMQQKEGVGIAANQIGKRLQIFIIEAESDNPRYKVLGEVHHQVFINPRITKVSENRKNFWHGCLSAEGEKRGNVATFEWIEYECQDQTGAIQKGRLDGFSAVIFQHEYRHLMNGTYLDHAQHLLAKEELDPKLASGELPFFEAASDTLPLLIEGVQLGKGLEEY
ncbi:peptide deformylase [Brumimicrobium aurantiacum]|uniref:Peptide deformylase n=1 Tax=Brumimicrobium aurantiacum TaxID=1737063 RepID=A0A3E1F153_9FLAO|nr:peptide deformylase [Brumimicrobium aurantiacum]RFC55546.1 peptide deformylase [Brumimicrobium aurantiacum]